MARYSIAVFFALALPLQARIDFAEKINPIFVKHCAACHGGVKDAGGINFIYRDKALAEGKSGLRAIVPGDPDDSELIYRVTLPPDDEEVMPKAEHGPPLSEEEIELLRQWIKEGAEWSGHWSFTPVEGSTERSIDDFIEEKWSEYLLTPSPEAPKEEWLRRVTLDLTGLLPTQAEVDAFLADQSAKAYEKVVDRLLQAPDYGERWASVWLDLARYADSEGLGQDHPREIYPFRNWVIEAFENDMPFTDFTVKQLAGDLLEDFTFDDLVATGFNRLTAQNSEGGTDDEEFRINAVMDRVATTYNVWQGLSMECAQCHGHPYDPILQKDYYKTMALFNNTVDADLGTHDTAIRVPENTEKRAELLESYRDLENVLTKLQNETHRWNQMSVWTAPDVEQFRTFGSSMKAKLRKTPKGEPDFIATGTPKNSAVHEVDFTLPAAKSLSALRLTVLPEDIKTARYQAEASFSLKNVRLRQTTADGIVRTIQSRVVYTSRRDTPTADALLNNLSNSGWEVPSKFFHAHWAVLVFDEPLVAAPGDEFQITLTHSSRRGNSNSVPLVVRRFQFHFTDDRSWPSAAADPERNQRIKQAQTYRRQLETTKGPRTLVMAEREPRLRRETRIFERGNWLDRGDVIGPGTPDSLPPLGTNEPTRLDFAQWLVSEENPLTARVWTNRLWHQLFGQGLVETLEDFGAVGMRPTHPQLLDHLAHRFMHDHGWSTKSMLKEIALSKAYRRSSIATAEQREKDPMNRYLSFGPRQRMTSEMVRDATLQVAGLLSDKRFGGVSHPPIPEGVWKPFVGGDKWKTPATGDTNRYRRMIYTYTKREIPFPAMAIFDAPSREFCEQRRAVSNTPLQALLTMNDEAYFEAATALAKRLEAVPGKMRDRVRSIYFEATTSQPDKSTLQKLIKARTDFLKTYRANPELAEELSATPEEAANIMLCNVILNLDEFLTR
ncbi:MAG: PSD1 and planctomycete cytochrome C domain-containing protein [Verrucomicrobiota bacterium]